MTCNFVLDFCLFLFLCDRLIYFSLIYFFHKIYMTIESIYFTRLHIFRDKQKSFPVDSWIEWFFSVTKFHINSKYMQRNHLFCIEKYQFFVKTLNHQNSGSIFYLSNVKSSRKNTPNIQK